MEKRRRELEDTYSDFEIIVFFRLTIDESFGKQFTSVFVDRKGKVCACVWVTRGRRRRRRTNVCISQAKGRGYRCVRKTIADGAGFCHPTILPDTYSTHTCCYEKKDQEAWYQKEQYIEGFESQRVKESSFQCLRSNASPTDGEEKVFHSQNDCNFM